jgi:large subunit ribosomal protein L30e
MAKKTISAIAAEFKKLLSEEKMVIGTEGTLKLLRNGKAVKVFLAANCSDQVKEDIRQYCNMGKVECVDLTQNNEEVGVLCRKPFAISVVGVAA